MDWTAASVMSYMITPGTVTLCLCTRLHVATKMLLSMEDRGQTDRVAMIERYQLLYLANPNPTLILTLTYDLDF